MAVEQRIGFAGIDAATAHHQCTLHRTLGPLQQGQRCLTLHTEQIPKDAD